MKTCELIRRTTPTHPAIGYGDTYSWSEGGSLLLAGDCRTCPNPWRPSDKVPWEKAYALIAPFVDLDCMCVDHPRFGICLLLNYGGKVATKNPNVNHNGAYYAKGIYWHAGGQHSSSPYWPGSAGCVTSHPDDFRKMMNMFTVGEECRITLKESI